MKLRPITETKYLWILIILISVIAIILKSVYRQFIYSNQINDYGIADSSPNFFAGLIIVFLYFTLYQKSSLKKHTIYAVIGLVGYELIQGSFFKNNFFDYKDIVASILGALIGYLICVKLKSQSLLSYQNIKGNKEV